MEVSKTQVFLRSTLVLIIFAFMVSSLMAGEVEEWKRYPLVTAPYLENPPVIDGRVERSEWQAAAMIGPLLNQSDGIADELERQVWIGYDDQQLYLAWSIERPVWVSQPSMPTKTGRIDAWGGGDFIEIMLDTQHDATNYYDFVVYANSAYADGHGNPGVDKTWNPDWQQAAAPTDHGWGGEVAIPFGELKFDTPPRPGTIWGFDVIDNQREPFRQVSTYGYRGPGWHKFKNFAHLRFGSRQDPAVRLIQAKEAGQNQIVVEFGVVNPSDITTTIQTHIELMRRKDDVAGGPKSYYDHVESGGDDAYEVGGADFAKTTTLDALVTQALTFYESVDEATLDQTTMVPAGQRRTVGFVKSTEAGEFLVNYELRHPDGTPLMLGVRTFRITSPLALDLQPYWLHSEVMDVVADLRKVPHSKGATIHFAIYRGDGEGEALTKTSTVVPEGRFRIEGTLSTADLEPGFYQVRARLVGADGKEITHSAAAIEKPQAPPWHNNQYGLRTKVPEPWTPLKASNDGVVEVWERIYDFSTLLPHQITSQGDDLLTSPVVMDLISDGKSVDWHVTSLKLEEIDEGHAIYRGVLESDLVTLSGTATIEFDGFVWYDLTLTPKAKSVEVDRMTLEVDFTPDHAKLLSHHRFLHDPVLSKKPIQPAKQGPEGVLAESLLPFTPHLWIGDESGGIAWIAEAPIDWHITRPDRVIEVQPAGPDNKESATLRINMIQAPIKLTESRRVIFGIQASPARPLPPVGTTHIAQRGGVVDQVDFYRSFREHGGRGFVAHSGWKGSPKSEIWGGWPQRPPNPERRETVKQGVKNAHDNDIKVSLYTGWGVATDSPEWKQFRYEMAKMPLENAGFGTYRQSAGLDGAYIDYMTWAIADLIKEYNIDGVFWDSTSNLNEDENLRIGSGWVDKQGRLRPGFAVLGTRELFKRVYTLFHGEMKSDGQIINFGGSIWCINIFADVFHRGEGTPMHVNKLRDAWKPMATYRANYDGRKYGLASLAMNKNFKGLAMTVNKHLAVTLLHGWHAKSTGIFDQEWSNPGQFLYGDKDVPLYKIWQSRSWLPLDQKATPHTYYGDGPKYINLMPKSLLSSAFTSGDGQRILLVVSNLDDKPVEAATVTLDLKGLGLKGTGPVEIEDAISHTALSIHDNAITFNIQPERYRLLKIWRSESGR